MTIKNETMQQILIQPLAFPKWNVEEELGYKPITTFWRDFSIAERFGLVAVMDTYRRAFSECKKNYKYLTELVMVLNHKIWQHYDPNKESPLAVLYNQLWEKAEMWAFENLKGEELDYFYSTLD